MPIISVIIPVYNVEPYIHRCVDSIQIQTFSDFELILVDDGSPDNCGAICDEYAQKDNRIVVIHKENGGLSDARNAGIDWAFSNSNSDWITFIDSDDWVHPKYLEVLFSVVAKNHVDIVSCGFLRIDTDVIENYVEIKPSVDINEPIVLLRKGYHHEEFNVTTAWGRLYKKSLFQNLRFPFGRYHEDEFSIYKAIFSCDRIAVLLEAPLYYYYQNEKGISLSKLTPKRMDDFLDAIFCHIEFFYTSGYFDIFQSTFQRYCEFVEQYTHEYGIKPEYFDTIKKHKKNIKQLINMYWKEMPLQLKKQGYRKWIGKQYYHNDIKTVREKRGVLYSFFWAICNYRKYGKL